MEKEHCKLVFLLTPLIFLLVLSSLYVDVLWGNNLRFHQRSKPMMLNKTVEEKQESLQYLLSRLMKGEDQNYSFACITDVHDSKHCVANQAVQIDTATMTVTVPSNRTATEAEVRPYNRQDDLPLLARITPVRILDGNLTPPVCEFNHSLPAIIFSSNVTGNVFHEVNEIIIPLFITTRPFKKRVILVLEDYNPSFVRKYEKILTLLTSHEILNPALSRGVHCFPGAVVGLRFHYHLTINSSDIPTGLSMDGFREFLRQSLNLRYRHVSQIMTPTVILLSRTSSRRIINEDEVVGMMEELGFRVIVVSRAKVISDLSVFPGIINSCSVLVGAHGAGLTNEIFLPDGGVMVQLDLIGLDWAARTYYGDTARGMRVHYLRYIIDPEESSLFRVFRSRYHRAIVDPSGAFSVDVGREVYLNGQNVRVDIARFRNTMVEAMSLIQNSPL